MAKTRNVSDPSCGRSSDSMTPHTKLTACVWVHRGVFVYVCVIACLCVCMCVSMCVYVCVIACVCVRMCVSLHAYVCVCVCRCMPTCVYVCCCVHVFAYVLVETVPATKTPPPWPHTQSGLRVCMCMR